MPRVPTYDNFQVNVSPNPTNAFSTALSVEAASMEGRQQQQMGKAIQSAGADMAAIVSDAQKEANQLRVDDALNQAKERALDLTYNKETGFINAKGIAALERKSGKALADEYTEQLEENLRKIDTNLGNDAQRAAFRARSQELVSNFYGNAMKHESQEFTTYATSVREGTIANAQNIIGVSYNDPRIVDGEIDRIKAAGAELGRLQGKSAEWIEANTRKLTSNAHLTAISAAVQNDDIIGADAYLTRYSKQMDADDILKVRQAIGKQLDVGIAYNAVDKTFANVAPRMQTSDGARAFNILLGSESNNKQFKDYGYGSRPDGTPKGRGFLGELKRPDGTISTEISVGYEINGKNMDIPLIVPTLSKKELDYLLTTDIKSKDFFTNMPAGIEEKAIAHAKQRMAQGKSVFADPEPLTSPKGAIGIAQVMPKTAPEAAKLAGLPFDEQRYKYDTEYNKALGYAYFTKQLQDFGGNLDQAYAAYNAGPQATKDALEKAKKDGGNYLAYLPKETQDYVAKNLQAYAKGEGNYAKPTIKEVVDGVRANLGDNVSPQVVKIAEDEAIRRYKINEASIDQRKHEATNAAIQGLINNGGNYMALPVEVRSAIPAESVERVMGFGKRLSAGEQNTNLAVYQKLAGDPAYLQNLSDAQFFSFRAELSEGDFKHFANQRNATRGAKAVAAAENLPSGIINDNLNRRLKERGIDPTPKETDEKDNQRIGAVRQYVNDAILADQKVLGRTMTDAEIEKKVDSLFAKSFYFRNLYLGIEGGLQQMPVLAMEVKDIPSDVKKAIESDLKKNGVINPNDKDILGVYFKLKMKATK